MVQKAALDIQKVALSEKESGTWHNGKCRLILYPCKKNDHHTKNDTTQMFCYSPFFPYKDIYCDYTKCLTVNMQDLIHFYSIL